MYILWYHVTSVLTESWCLTVSYGLWIIHELINHKGVFVDLLTYKRSYLDSRWTLVNSRPEHKKFKTQGPVSCPGLYFGQELFINNLTLLRIIGRRVKLCREVFVQNIV